MRFAVETWAPEFGAPAGDEVLGESDAEVDITVECGAHEWAPIAPAAPSAATRARCQLLVPQADVSAQERFIHTWRSTSHV